MNFVNAIDGKTIFWEKLGNNDRVQRQIIGRSGQIISNLNGKSFNLT